MNPTTLAARPAVTPYPTQRNRKPHNSLSSAFFRVFLWLKFFSPTFNTPDRQKLQFVSIRVHPWFKFITPYVMRFVRFVPFVVKFHPNDLSFWVGPDRPPEAGKPSRPARSRLTLLFRVWFFFPFGCEPHNSRGAPGGHALPNTAIP